MSDPSTYNFYRRRQLTSINSVKRLRRKTASTTTTLSASNVETSYASTTAVSKAGASAASAASARSSSSTNVYFLALLLSGILLLGLFTVKTWTRNYDWNSRRALFRWVQSLLYFAKVLYTPTYSYFCKNRNSKVMGLYQSTKNIFEHSKSLSLVTW